TVGNGGIVEHMIFVVITVQPILQLFDFLFHKIYLLLLCQRCKVCKQPFDTDSREYYVEFLAVPFPFYTGDDAFSLLLMFALVTHCDTCATVVCDHTAPFPRSAPVNLEAARCNRLRCLLNLAFNKFFRYFRKETAPHIRLRLAVDHAAVRT